MQSDYYSAPPSPSGPTAAGEPPAAGAAGPAVDRRPSPSWAFLVVLGLLVAMGAWIAVAAGRVEATPSLRQVVEPAPAADGWGPTWVDDLGRPARWDPCAPIRFVVNPGWMPDQGRRDLVDALARITAASGLRFVDDGDTDEVPGLDRSAYQPERYGQRWAPLLVSWVPPARTDLGLGQGVQGVSLSVVVPGVVGGSIVSGQVALDADRRLASGFGPGDTEGEVLLHELAHAVGLGHVLDPTQVMYSTTTNSESEFGAGDREGLAALGAGAGCLPAPQARPLRFAP